MSIVRRIIHGWRRGSSIESRAGILFPTAYLIVFVALLLYPLLSTAWLSLHKADLFGGSEFVGIDNYARLLRDPVFRKAIANTCYFVLLTAPTLTLLGLALALMLNNRSSGFSLLRGLFFSSSALSVTIVALIWRMVLMTEGGLISNILSSVGLAPIPFLNDARLTLPAIAITTVWWGIGLPMMLFLAALQQVPKDLYEAAKLDNAGRWRTLTSITLPSIRRTTLVVLIIEVVLQFQMLGQAEAMTSGGPNNSSLTVVLFIHQVAFRHWDVGYAAAASAILLCIILTTGIIRFFSGRPATPLR